MGYLTTFTIYNDCADQITKDKEFAEKIRQACSSIQINRGSNWESLGNCANGIILQKPRHADHHTLYMHAGNTVIDVQDIDGEHEWSIDTFINEMEYQLKQLKIKKNR